MSGAPTAAVCSTIANSLSNPSVLSDEERLFQEALEAAKKIKSHNGQTPALFDKLANARGVDDVDQAVNASRRDNKVWKERHEKHRLNKFKKLAGTIQQYKSLIDSLVAISPKIGNPLWGSVAFVLGIFKGLSDAEDVLKRISTCIESTLHRFSEYVRHNEPLQGSLRNALFAYYKSIIVFALSMFEQYSHSLMGTLLRATSGSLKELVTTFEKELGGAVNNVDWGSRATQDRRRDQQYQEILSAIQNSAGTPGTVSAGSTIKTPGLPKMLSRHFTGRQRIINHIAQSLQRSPGDQTQTAIYGMGGVGKTQILLRYADINHPKHGDRSLYNKIYYINASSAQAVQTSLATIVQTLEAERVASTGKTADPQRLKDWLIRHERWLLLVDDVKSLSDVMTFLPAGDKGHILFSTREKTIATILTTGEEPIEVLPMDLPTSAQLAQNWAQLSDLQQDKDISTAMAVAQWARGLPLAIEQIVKGSCWAERPIIDTLQQVRQKQYLLEQHDPVCFDSERASVAAVVQQTMEDLRRRDAPAEALFRVLAYLEPSSIPMHMLRKGLKQVLPYTSRQIMFDRGHVQNISLKEGDADVIVKSAPTPKTKTQESLRSQRYTFAKSKAKKLFKAQPDPRSEVDGMEMSSESAFIGEDNPLFHLFKDERLLRYAIVVLQEAALLRHLPKTETIWVHDLFAEVAQALIQKEGEFCSKQAAGTAAILVYLAFPVPLRNSCLNRSFLYRQFLPHARSCCHHLRDLQILNDFSVGPELSHVVASTMAGTPPWVDRDPFVVDESKIQASDRKRLELIEYYRYALMGYMASHHRQMSDQGITQQGIVEWIRAERKQLPSSFSTRDFSYDFQRFGRSAFWRALQTMMQLSSLLEWVPSREALAEAISMTTTVLRCFEIIFGREHDDSISVREGLVATLLRTEHYEEARSCALAGVKALLGWDEETQTCTGTIIVDNNVIWESRAVGFLRQAAECCLRLGGVSNGRQAVVYTKLRLAHASIGGEHYTQTGSMEQLAIAYEQSGETIASIYWFGRAVLCRLSVLVWEVLEVGEDELLAPWCGMVLGAEELIEETVAKYEQARERLGFLDWKEYSAPLSHFLAGVDMHIEWWRADRARYGLPYPKPPRMKFDKDHPLGYLADEDASVSDVVSEIDWDAAFAQPPADPSLNMTYFEYLEAVKNKEIVPRPTISKKLTLANSSGDRES